MKWFNKQSRILQIILLLIPVVNWWTEIIVRVSACIQKTTLTNVLGLILAIIPVTGMILGWVDLVSVLLVNHLFWAN